MRTPIYWELYRKMIVVPIYISNHTIIGFHFFLTSTSVSSWLRQSYFTTLKFPRQISTQTLVLFSFVPSCCYLLSLFECWCPPFYRVLFFALINFDGATADTGSLFSANRYLGVAIVYTLLSVGSAVVGRSLTVQNVLYKTLTPAEIPYVCTQLRCHKKESFKNIFSMYTHHRWQRVLRN